MAGWIHAITESLATLAMTVGSPFYTSLATVPWPVPGSDEYVRFYSYEDPCAHTPNGDTVVFSTLSGTGCWLQWKPRIDGTQVTTALGFTPYNASNPSGYITSGALVPYATTTSVTAALGGKENAIAAGTTAQYWRGDKTWQAFPSIPTILPRSFANNVGRTLNSSFTISSTRDALVSYSINAAWNIAALLSGTGSAFLEYSTDAGSTWITVNQVGKTLNLLTFAGQDDMNLVGLVPANALVRIRSSSTNMTITYTRGQETLL